MHRTNLTVGRTFVEQVIGVHLDFFIGIILGNQMVVSRLPGVVNGVMLEVLRDVLARSGSFKQSGLNQPVRHLVNADGPRSSADALESNGRETSNGEGCIEHQTPDSVSPCHVVDAALHLPAGQLSSDAFCYGLCIVVVAVLNHDESYALGVVFRTCPKLDAFGVVLAHHNDERGAVQPAKVREGSGGVASARADVDPLQS